MERTLLSRRPALAFRQVGKNPLKNDYLINSREACTALARIDICHLTAVTLITHPCNSSLQ